MPTAVDRRDVATMSNHRDQRVRPEVILDALVNQEARVAGDIVEIGAHTWAIHASIPVDGDVIIGEYDSPEAAHAVLEQLAVAEEPGA